MGFALLFLGLDLLKDSVPDINNNPQILDFLASYTDMGFVSVLIFLGIGALLTVVIQSSSATMALTLVMCHNGMIGYEMAAAMILGQNIGTTITAILASLIANTSAKRAAAAHLIFNIIGTIWVLALFNPIVDSIAVFTEKLEGVSPLTSVLAIPVALSIFHTVFNITNVLLQIWFVNYIEKIVRVLVRQKKDEEEEFGLKFISTGMLSTSELSILQARKEIAEYGLKSVKMFNQAKKLFAETEEKKFKKINEKLAKNELIMDDLEAEIANYLTSVSEGELSISGARRVRTLLKISDNIESLADASFNLSKNISRKQRKKIWFTPEQRASIHEMFVLIDDNYAKTMELLCDDTHDKFDISDIIDIELQINALRTKLKKENNQNLKDKKYSYSASVVYIDMITICETLGDHLINIAEAIKYQKEEMSSHDDD